MAFTPVFPTQGGYPLTSIGGLPNVTVSFPGEHWTNGIASGVILPGEAIIPVAAGSGGKLAWRVANSADFGDPRMCIAKQPVSVPDVNTGSIYNPALGPNEIVNLPILTGAYVHNYRTGAFHLTLCTPQTYNPGDLLAWNESGARPDGKPGGAGYTGSAVSLGSDSTGCWDTLANIGKNTTANFPLAVFEVMEFRPYISSNSFGQPEGIVTVKSLRAQF